MTRRSILVVDDEPGILRAVRRVLGRTHDVVCAGSAAEAIELCAESAPDLAIVDVRMPEMDGFELSGRLKVDHPDLDVILMTGSVGEIDRKLARAIRQKVFYFIEKPFDREVLTCLVERCLELRSLAEQNRRHVRRLEAALAAARAFQSSLFPDASAYSGAVPLHARHVSCDDLCGDLYDFAAAGPGRTAFVVADVSGHGAPAAMLTGVVKSAFQSCCREEFAPDRVVQRIAGGIRTFRPNRFVTLFCGLHDVGSRSVTYVNAGHPPPVLCRGDEQPLLLDPTGPLVSPVLDDAVWSERTVRFDPEHRLLVYTDGIIEAPGEGGDYGLDRLIEDVRRVPSGGKALVEAVLSRVKQFMKGRRVEDDLTLLALGGGGSLPDQSLSAGAGA